MAPHFKTNPFPPMRANVGLCLYRASALSPSAGVSGRRLLPLSSKSATGKRYYTLNMLYTYWYVYLIKNKFERFWKLFFTSMQLWQLELTVPVFSRASKSYGISQETSSSAASLNQWQASPPRAAPATLLKADLPWNSGLQTHLAGNSRTPTNEKNTSDIWCYIIFITTVLCFHLTWCTFVFYMNIFITWFHLILNAWCYNKFLVYIHIYSIFDFTCDLIVSYLSIYLVYIMNV